MIAITIDCEEWSSPLLRNKIVPENNNTDFSREGTENILKILDKNKIKATFFITGYFAEREKELVKKILDSWHEIGSHGYSHLYRGNKNINIKKDVLKSKKVLEKIIKKKIEGFRAPQMQFSLELLKVLDDANFKYDSSLNPSFMPGFYNHSKSPLKIHVPLKTSKIREIPVAATPFLRLPVNWLFMRNFHIYYSILACKILLLKKITPVLYIHAWEFTNVNSKHVPFYLTRNTGDKFCKKFEKFLKAFKNEKFVTLSSLV